MGVVLRKLCGPVSSAKTVMKLGMDTLARGLKTSIQDINFGTVLRRQHESSAL
jgi:hypothetical protein